MLSLKDTKSLLEEVEKILREETHITEVPVGSYAKMRYPKYFPCFRFKVRQYSIENFGTVMMMQTKAMGIMNLATMAFTPNLGTNLPFLLIDSMSFKKKRTVFIEYYDCTARKLKPETLVSIARQYQSLPDYEEKPAWYVPLRTSYSLIKGNTKKEEAKLVCMLLSEVKAYVKLSKVKLERNERNLSELREFRERMITEGNPSSTILKKVLGEEGAAVFYRNYVMPLE